MPWLFDLAAGGFRERVGAEGRAAGTVRRRTVSRREEGSETTVIEPCEGECRSLSLFPSLDSNPLMAGRGSSFSPTRRRQRFDGSLYQRSLGLVFSL